MRAIQLSQFGGPEVLHEVEVPDPVPGPGQVLVEVSAAGVNYADLSRITGTYGGVTLPFIPGSEIVGRAADGQRVVALTFAGGGFAEQAVVTSAEYPLAEARQAFADIVARRTTGKVVLRTT